MRGFFRGDFRLLFLMLCVIKTDYDHQIFFSTFSNPGFSCKQSKLSDIEIIKFNPKIIDSLKQASDTSYNEIIGASDFYAADYYITRKDTITTKILKDSLGHVVAVNKSKNGREFICRRILYQRTIGWTDKIYFRKGRWSSHILLC